MLDSQLQRAGTVENTGTLAVEMCVFKTDLGKKRTLRVESAGLEQLHCQVMCNAYHACPQCVPIHYADDKQPDTLSISYKNETDVL